MVSFHRIRLSLTGELRLDFFVTAASDIVALELDEWDIYER